MSKTLVLLAVVFLVYSAYSQATCADGYLVSAVGSDANKGQCTACIPICKTCTVSPYGCVTYIDSIKGLTNGVPICNMGIGFYYNSDKDSCDFCAEGCAACYVDYNVCISCKQGWDFDFTSRKCLRATVGLAAVVLALSVLLLVVAVISCICACKI